MKIAILGFAGQGQSALDYWSAKKADITICDRDSKLKVPKGIKHRLGKDYLKDLDKFDLLVRTPALHPNDIVEANPKHPDILKKVTTVTNEFFKVCPTTNIIGVTGTKGKGTTSTLIARMLEASGYHTHLGGNIGIPPLDLLKNGINPSDWVVLELANFQLIDLQKSPHIGVCLMVVEEHLDWHTDMAEYITAKQQMFAYQNIHDTAIYYADSEASKAVASISKAKQIPYFKAPGAYVDGDNIVIDNRAVCAVKDVKLLGKHNLQNVCAAITAVWQVTQDAAAIQWTLQTFSGLPFRIELREEVDSVRYYNDSFATSPEATLAAVESITGTKVLIVGGFERGLDLSSLARGLVENQKLIRNVLVIGESAKRTAETLKAAGFEKYSIVTSKDMDHIVKLASEEAKPGDAVVLSPGFASFDMFKNFEERGIAFNEAVESL